MTDKDNLLTVSQFARLRGTTAETLRHYDRIGLLSPVYIDPETNYRFYSILQYEQLGTIMELRNLNFSLDEIREFFSHRSVEHSLEVLKEHRTRLHEELTRLKREENAIDEKIRFIRDLPPRSRMMLPEVTDQPDRYYITNDDSVTDDEGIGYSFTALESRLQDEVSPVLASDRMGLFVDCSEDYSSLRRVWKPFIFVKKKRRDARVIPAGRYASITSMENWPEQEKSYALLYDFVRRNNLEITGGPFMFFTIDITITEKEGEFAFTIQLPIKN